MADNIPEGLEDLLNSIRNEGKKPQSSSALAVIPKAEKKETDLVDEDIDPLILRLLGLDDVFDIDYDTYKTLLREKMVAGRMPDSKMPTEEVEILTNEFKRVKGKTGRFKVKKQAIKAESFVAKKRQPTTTKAVKALPGTTGSKPPLIKPAVEPKEEKVDQSMKVLADKISDTNNNIKKIVDNDKKKNDLENKKGEKDRISAERTRKVIREERAERGRMAAGMSNALSSAIAPVKGVLDVIGDFLKRFLIGTAIMELIKLLEMGPAAYFQPVFDWMNGIIKKFEDAIKDLINKIVSPINNKIEEFNAGVSGIVDSINNEFNKLQNIGVDIPDIPSPSVPSIPTPDPSQQFIPRIPNIFGTPTGSQTQSSGQPTSTSVASGPGGSGQDFATLATVAALESGSAQGRADVAQSVYNRLADKLYGKSITDILTRQGQYQVAFKDPTATRGPGTEVAAAFKNIKTEDDAVKAITYYYKARGQSVTEDRARQMYRQSASAISDPKLRENAAKFVGGRTEFRGYATGTRGEVHRGSRSDNYFSMQYGSGKQMSRGAASVPTGLFNPPSSSKISQPTVTSKPTATVSDKKPDVTPPASPGSGGLTALPIPISSENQSTQQTNTSTANQKNIPTFSAYDRTNSNYLVIKSIYNIVG